MAIIHTNLQDISQFQSALDSATAAGANVDSAINAAGTALSDFNDGTPIFDTFTDTQITGHVVDAVGFVLGVFVFDGSHLLSPPAKLTHVQYINNSPVATIELFGNVTITASETGTWTRLTYQSATLDFEFQGTINDQNLPGLQPFNFSTFSLDLSGSPNVHESFQGSIRVSNGVLSGTVTAASLEVDGQYIQATGLNHNAAILNSSDANFIESSFLNGNDTIFGEGINQTLDGFGGNDTINAGVGNDILNGGIGNDTLNGNDGNDTLNGGAGADNLQGGAGDDVMDGGAGNDTYVVDSLGDTVTETLVGAAGGTDLVQSAVNFTLGANIENLTLTGLEDLSGTGNALNNILSGNSGNNQLMGLAGNDRLLDGAGNDTLDGGTGADKMAGGLGNDTYTVDVATDVVTEALNGGTDQVVASLNYTLGANVENLELTGSALNGTGNTLANILTGNSENNTLSGLAGNDQLNGGDGNDILIGGLGQDTVNGGAGDDQITMLVTANNVDTIDAGADTDTLVLSGVVPGDHVVVVDLSSSTDQVVSIGGTPDSALVQINFENLNASGIGSSVTVTGSDGANNIIGSKGNDSLEGGTGNDTLNGGLGADSMAGGLDDDTYTVDNLGDTVTEVAGEGTDTININRSVDLNLAFNEIENVLLTGIATINATGDGGTNLLIGNSAANILTGGDGNDQLTGNAGNDLLNGGTGDDAMEGGAGNDTYVVDSLGDSVTETLAGAVGGTDLVQSAVDFTLGANVEKLTLTGSADINGTGNALNNILTGNSGNNQLMGGAGNDRIIGGVGNDTLDGGAGRDNMAGGLGDDTYTVDLATDVVTEALNGGSDQVVASLTYTLGANVENLELTGSGNLNGTGNSLNNIITGNSGNNTLSGLLGNDQLDGGDGNDLLLGGLGTDTVTGGAADDQITMLVTAGNVDTIDAGDDTDTLLLSGVVPGNHEVVVDLGSTIDQVVSIGGVADALTQINFENLTAAGLGSFVTVTGSAGANSIIGSKGNDTLIGGGGNDTLSGLAGNDTFGFGLGDGQDLIQDSSGSADKVLFDGGINPLDLVISQQANDLRLAIHGSSDQITVQNWYVGTTNRTETIQAGNGDTLSSTQVNQLIQAMAAFTLDTGLSWDAASGGGGTPDQQAQFQGIIAANWE